MLQTVFHDGRDGNGGRYGAGTLMLAESLGGGARDADGEGFPIGRGLRGHGDIVSGNPSEI